MERAFVNSSIRFFNCSRSPRLAEWRLEDDELDPEELENEELRFLS